MVSMVKLLLLGLAALFATTLAGLSAMAGSLLAQQPGGMTEGEQVTRTGTNWVLIGMVALALVAAVVYVIQRIRLHTTHRTKS